MSRLHGVLLSALLLSATAAMVAVAGAFFYLWPTIRRIDAATVPLLECKGNGACLPAQILAISGSARYTMGQVARAAPEIAQSIKVASAKSAATSERAQEVATQTLVVMRQVQEVAKGAESVTVELAGAARELHGAIAGMHGEVTTLLGSTDRTMRSAGAALDQLTGLEQQLQQALAEDNPKALEIADAMLAVIQNKSVTDTLDHIATGTASGAEILTTVDIATRGLRTKAALIKRILLWIGGRIQIRPW
jgi:hypothetical protein